MYYIDNIMNNVIEGGGGGYRSNYFLATILSFVLLVVSCGGGSGVSSGGGSGSGSGGGSVEITPINRDSAVRLTGGQAAQENTSSQLAKGPSIFASADKMDVSTVYGETDFPELPTFIVPTSCSGLICTIRLLQTDVPFNLRDLLRDSQLQGETNHVVLTKHGITTLEMHSDDFKAYGAWLSHSAFFITAESKISFQGFQEKAYSRAGISGGRLTGARPTATATWQGLMIGTPQTGSKKGDFLQGDAMLTFDTSNNSIDAAFSSIKNLSEEVAYSVPSINFNNIPVSATGTFGAGNTGNKIQGGFYGTNHAETAGVFEQAGVVGAFGAKKN